MGFFTDVHVGRLIAYSIAIVQFPSIIFTGNISIKSSEESVFLHYSMKSPKAFDIDSNLKLVINEEDKGKNFTVRIGEINPKEKEKEEQTTSEAKLGSVKFEKKNDWFSRLKLK